MTGGGQFYRGYGLTISSMFAIPGAVPLGRGMGQPDIVISAGDTAIGPVDVALGPYQRSGDALLLDVPGVARYLARSEGQMVVEPYPSARADDVSALLVATGLPMLLWMRGGIVLHAAGLIMPGATRAIALAGPSGIGKSSLAQRLLAGGARLLGDDSLLLSDADGETMASGLPASYFLPGDLAEQRDLFAVPAKAQVEYAPLGAVIILSAAEPETVSLPSQLGGAAALEAVLQNRHRPRVPDILGRSSALLPVAALHCRNLAVYRLGCPQGDLAEAQLRLERLIAAIPLQRS
jgi:hypothetical protein